MVENDEENKKQKQQQVNFLTSLEAETVVHKMKNDSEKFIRNNIKYINNKNNKNIIQLINNTNSHENSDTITINEIKHKKPTNNNTNNCSSSSYEIEKNYSNNFEVINEEGPFASNQLNNSSLSINIHLPTSANHNNDKNNNNNNNFDVNINSKIIEKNNSKESESIKINNFNLNVSDDKNKLSKNSDDETKKIKIKKRKNKSKNNKSIFTTLESTDLDILNADYDILLIEHKKNNKSKLEPLNNLNRNEQEESFNNLIEQNQNSTNMSVSSKYDGMPISNGFMQNKVNPSTSNEFAYLNRNKLVNRRLAIKKQIESSIGLKPITKSYPNYNKVLSEFKLTNPQEAAATDFVKFSDDFQLYRKPNSTKSNPNFNFNNSNHDIDDFYSRSLNAKEFLANNDLNQHEYTSYKSLGYNNQDNDSNEIMIVKKSKPRLMSQTQSYKTSSITIIEKNQIKPDKNSIQENISPFSYHIPRRPPNEKIAPMFTIGKRCFTEKEGGGRTSWQKEYFSSKNPYLIKSDFNREIAWPTPANYRLKSLIGDSESQVYHKAPVISIGSRVSATHQFVNQNTNLQPMINGYPFNEPNKMSKLETELLRLTNVQGDDGQFVRSKTKLDLESDVLQSVKFVAPNAPKVSIKFRHNGTELWNKPEETPGPGSYDHNKFKSVAKTRPVFTLPQAKLKLNL